MQDWVCSTQFLVQRGHVLIFPQSLTQIHNNYKILNICRVLYFEVYHRFLILFIYFEIFFNHQLYFPAQFAGGFTVSDLLDKPWSLVSSLLPPGTCLHFLSRIEFSIPTARRLPSKVANSRSRAFR